MKDVCVFLELEFGAGTDFEEAAYKALEVAMRMNIHVKYKFNGSRCTVYNNREKVVEGIEAMVKMYEAGKDWCHN